MRALQILTALLMATLSAHAVAGGATAPSASAEYTAPYDGATGTADPDRGTFVAGHAGANVVFGVHVGPDWLLYRAAYHVDRVTGGDLQRDHYPVFHQSVAVPEGAASVVIDAELGHAAASSTNGAMSFRLRAEHTNCTQCSIGWDRVSVSADGAGHVVLSGEVASSDGTLPPGSIDVKVSVTPYWSQPCDYIGCVYADHEVVAGALDLIRVTATG